MADAGSAAAASFRAWSAELVPDPGPARKIVLLTFVQALGTGVFLSSSAIFLTTVVGIAPRLVGIGLSVAGLAGLLAAVPAGRVGDRVGPAVPLATTYAALAVLFLGYAAIGGFASFVVLASLIAAAETAGSPLRSALAYAAFGRGAVRVRAQMRSSFNLGFAAGAAASAVAIAAGSRTAFVAVLFVNALSQAACALLALRVLRTAADSDRPAATSPASQPMPAPDLHQPSALRDGSFVLVALVSGALELYAPLMTVGLPLWIISHTSAPATLNAALLVVNTVGVVLFQVAMSRGTTTAAEGARRLRLGGVLLAGACLVYAASAWGGPVVASVVLLTGSLVLVLGELAQSAGAYAVSFELPPPGRQGAYQGVFALGRGLQQFVGPALVTSLAVGLGVTGWLVLAMVFVVLGVCSVPLVSRVERRKEVAR